MANVVSAIHSSLLETLQGFWHQDPQCKQLIEEVSINPTTHPHYSWQNNLLKRKEKVVVGTLAHDTHLDAWLPIRGLSGVDATYKKVKTLFF